MKHEATKSFRLAESSEKNNQMLIAISHPKRTHHLCLIGVVQLDMSKTYRNTCTDKESSGFTKYPESKQQNHSKARTRELKRSQFWLQSCTYNFGI